MSTHGASAPAVRGQRRVGFRWTVASLAAAAFAGLASAAAIAPAAAVPAGGRPAYASMPSCANERSCVDRVLELENERLALMPAVAAWKWRHHAAVSDRARERVVIAESAKLAQSSGLLGPPIERLFALQIRLATDVETASQHEWRERGFDSSQPDLDLARDLRPQIDRLTHELLSSLRAAEPALASADFVRGYSPDADRLLRASGWTPATRHELLVALAAVRPAAAAAPARQAAAHSTRLILLGTNGGPAINQSRSESSSLLVVDGKAYLVDAGSGTIRQIVQAGEGPERIRGIFITHHHIDHDAGLPSVLDEIWFLNAWEHLEAPPTRIYGPPATRFLVHAALEYLSVSERIFRAGVPALAPAAGMFEAHDIDHDGLILDDGTVRVTAAENTHFYFKSGSRETGRDRSYAYRFDTPAGSVVFTGDTGPSEAVTRLATGADVLVSEICAVCSPAGLAPPQAGRGPAPPPAGPAPRAGRPQLPADLAAQERFHLLHEHVTPDEVGEMAAQAHVKVLVLTHLVPGTAATDMTRFTAPIAKHFTGAVIPGRDFLEYDLNAPRG
ncbi:MAG TPA: MBL fold metallo-hydrolase [Steroidobacteraceae bacterium]|nr:MBL fold metallo-hydrolase [Steroidobacteraceae bacterium]